MAALDYPEDYLSAIDRLALLGPSLQAYPRSWLERAIGHLWDQLERYFRDFLRPKSEHQALALIRSVGAELQKASHALDVAAYALREAGQGAHAAKAKHAAGQAREAAEGLTG